MQLCHLAALYTGLDQRAHGDPIERTDPRYREALPEALLLEIQATLLPPLLQPSILPPPPTPHFEGQGEGEDEEGGASSSATSANAGGAATEQQQALSQQEAAVAALKSLRDALHALLTEQLLEPNFPAEANLKQFLTFASEVSSYTVQLDGWMNTTGGNQSPAIS